MRTYLFYGTDLLRNYKLLECFKAGKLICNGEHIRSRAVYRFREEVLDRTSKIVELFGGFCEVGL